MEDLRNTTKPRRINVELGERLTAAVVRCAEVEDTTLTAAMRLLLLAGAAVYDHTQKPDTEIIEIDHATGKERELIII